jgi:hypothetical protein
MDRNWGLYLAALLLAAPSLSVGADEGNLNADGFAKIVAKIEWEEARAFYAAHEGAGSRYTFPVVWDLAELTPEDMWLSVDGEKVAVEPDHLCAFLRAMAAAGVTMTAEGKSVRYELRGSPPAGEGTKRSVGQADPPKTKAKRTPAKKKQKESGAGAAEGPTYRLTCRYGSGLTYGDVVLSSANPGDTYADMEVGAVVDDLQFKDFPYNSDGDAQKLFRECEKKMEGLMSSPWGREKVLRTYAYYDTKGQSWKTDLLEEILDYYGWGKIAKE